MLAVAI